MVVQIPLDGTIVHGEASVSSELITGEALPVRRSQGHEVPAGAVNHDGLLVIKTSRPASQSTPARIASLTRQAQVSTLLSKSFWCNEVYSFIKALLSKHNMYEQCSVYSNALRFQGSVISISAVIILHTVNL